MEYTREVAELIRLLETVDRQITPQHIARQLAALWAQLTPPRSRAGEYGVV